MCGRTACTLEPGVIQKACSYVDPKTKEHKQPEWREHPGRKSDLPTTYQYYPSANVTPTKFTPVLVKRSNEDLRALQPMMWGMIPPWHKADPKTHGMSTNNARLEGLKESKLYKRPLKEKRLCVVVAQGFYEWKEETNKKAPKQPYFIFMSQDQDGIKGFEADDVANESAWNRGTWSEDEGWKGPRILMMAGLYDVWNSPEGDPVYSYSIITRDSNKTLSWLHHRMPAILETPEQVEAWLNPDPNATIDDLIAVLNPVTALQWYPVNPKVGNSRCTDLDCAKRYEPKENKSKTFMDSWLKRAPKVKAETDEDTKESSPKKPKLEN